MKLFDYIFYRITEFYKSISNDLSDYIIGPVIVTSLQMLNIFAFLLALSLFFKEILILFDKNRITKNMSILFIFITLLFAFNIYRYGKIQNFDKLKKRWQHDDDITRKRKTKIVIFYILISIAITIYLTIIYK